MQAMWKRYWVGIVFIALLVLIAGEANADLIHQSQEDYFANGATGVIGCIGSGCPAQNFSFGTPQGSALWQIDEKVFHVDGNTEYNYVVFNDILEENITSVHVESLGLTPLSFTAPLNWEFLDTGSLWVWSTDGPGISKTDSLSGFSVTVAGEIGVTFTTVFIDVFNGEEMVFLQGENWRVSGPSVPEPSTLLLLGAGLVGLGVGGRKTLRR